MFGLFIRKLRRRRRIKALKRNEFDPDQIRNANQLLREAAKRHRQHAHVGRHLGHEVQYFEMDWTLPDLEENN